MNISLISRFFDNRNEGIGSYSKMLLQGLKKKKMNLTTVSQDDSYFKSDGLLDYICYFYLELPFILDKSEDIYHALSPIESIRLDKSKSVVTIHDLMPIKIPHLIHKNKLLSYQSQLFFKIAIRKALKCEKLVTISEETAKDIENSYSIDLDDISIVRQGINSNLFPKKVEADETYTIGTLSNINYRKRIDILIKAFKSANIENSKLFIGGKGPHIKYLKKLAKDDDRIIFLGFIPNEEINNFYNSLDVFIFPSFMEGYGLPMVEAMACCKPVVTLDDSHIPSDVKKRTYKTTKEDLVDVLKNRNYECDIKSNYKFAKEHSIENMANGMMNVYNQLL